MLTGDNERTARAISAEAGIGEVIAGVLPDGKAEAIRRLSGEGKVAMVGDGINDAPALTAADTGIAIGAGTDIALDAADVVLMNSRLSDVVTAIRISRATLRNIHENLFWAFFYNVIGIPLAAGVWIPLFGWTLNPMFGAAAMSLSSFSVVTNALRLNLLKPDRRTRRETDGGAPTSFPQMPEGADRSTESNKTEEKNTMEKTLKVEGMMCGHCEKHVADALRKVPGVAGATADHEAGVAVVTLTRDVPEPELRSAVEAAGYTVV